MSDSYKAIVRVGDQITGTCNAHNHPINVTGVWTQGSGISDTEGKAMIRVSDIGEASCGHTFFGVSGSSVFFSEDKAIMRVGDPVNIQGGNGICVSGSEVSFTE